MLITIVMEFEMLLFLQILRDLDVQSMKLMTNNPSKYIGLKVMVYVCCNDNADIHLR